MLFLTVVLVLIHRRYHRLKKEWTLCENFAGKTIIEFPKLIVVLGSQLADYSLTESPSVKETLANPTSVDMSPQLQLQVQPSLTEPHAQPSLTEQHGQDSERVCEYRQRYPDNEWSEDEETSCTGLKLIAQSYGDSSFSDEGSYT